ncbi:GTPase-activating protein [Rhodotorula sphaerocarpa]
MDQPPEDAGASPKQEQEQEQRAEQDDRGQDRDEPSAEASGDNTDSPALEPADAAVPTSDEAEHDTQNNAKEEEDEREELVPTEEPEERPHDDDDDDQPPEAASTPDLAEEDAEDPVGQDTPSSKHLSTSSYGSVASGHASLSAESLRDDDETPTVAQAARFEAPLHPEGSENGDAEQANDASDADVSDVRDARLALHASSPQSFRRPFSLVSDPDSPLSSAASSPEKTRPRRPSLLPSSLSATTDPTNVGRDSSASLTQAVWRQSMGLNSPTLARGLVEVHLSDEQEQGERDEEAEEERKRKRRSAAMSWNSVRVGTGTGNGSGSLRDGDSWLNGRRTGRRRSRSDSHALDAAFEVDETASRDDLESSSLTDSISSPTRSRNVPIGSHGRSGSYSTAIATPHAADGFISHRASANISSLAQPVSPANPPTSNSGIRALQANFESLRTLKEREHGENGEEAEDIDWEFWGRVMSDYEAVAQSQRNAAKDENLESVYSELLKQSSPHEKSIARDLNRTFPKHTYFKDAGGVGQENLFNVVKAYSIYDDEVGYTQGLQFIVGPLLLNMPDEEAFCVLVRLMKAYDLRSHYTPNMPGLQLRLFQFDRLVEELVPSVFLHLLRQGVKSSMYASQWFLTLFGYRLPLELVSSVFDLVFAEGVEALFRFAVALLKRNEAYLLTLEFEDLIDFLKNGLFEAYAPDERELMRDPDAQYRIHEFVRDALQVRLTPMMLDQFAQEWAALCAAQTAHNEELEALRQANLQLSRQVRQLESSLAQINTEHCELVKQVVAARLEREDLEDELVKYKLAYADLSHVAAASQASTSPVESRRESEVGLAASPDDRRNSTSPGPLTGSGLTAGLGAFGGRWFGGTGRGSISSTMSRNGSQ